ncbi:hypothetical protein SUGI_0754590 [Cryptomeria japonica]|nr:hypothetical protein SUGI_0754590 [Cryptomeria japonica]
MNTPCMRAMDDVGLPALALINRATDQALRHGRSESPYHLDDLNEDVLFTQSAYVGRRYQCIKPVNNIHFKMTAMFQVDMHNQRIYKGVEIALFKWNKKDD